MSELADRDVVCVPPAPARSSPEPLSLPAVFYSKLRHKLRLSVLGGGETKVGEARPAAC